jgi:hypothetical protein
MGRKVQIELRMVLDILQKMLYHLFEYRKEGVKYCEYADNGQPGGISP